MPNKPYNNIKTSITLNETDNKIIEKYCKLENRSRSNMISQMIRAYNQIHNSKY